MVSPEAVKEPEKKRGRDEQQHGFWRLYQSDSRTQGTYGTDTPQLTLTVCGM
jgi:hypothetical protein